MKDTEWRHYLHKTLGELNFIADSLHMLDHKFNDDMTLEEVIIEIGHVLKEVLDEATIIYTKI